MTIDLLSEPGLLAPARTCRMDFDDGSFVLRSPEPLQPYDRCVGEWIERWAARTPDDIAFAERRPDGSWRRLTWRETREAIGAIGQALLDFGVPKDRPVVILSDNSVDHALLMLATLHIGRTACSVSSAYCRLTTDHAKIRSIIDALDPALIYASNATVYGPAIGACTTTARIVLSVDAHRVAGALSFDSLMQAKEGPDVAQAFKAITPDDHAKYLLTSGSTGQPKVVINTHRMLCANQQMIGQAWPFLAKDKPVLLDWLPWSHTFGGNHNFNLVLRNGGTLYVDDGRPSPQLVARTVANLREVKPTLLFNVPAGFDMMLPHLEADDALAAEALSRLQMIFYAGAALPASTWHRLEAVARKVRAAPLWLTTSWGATETAPAVTSAHWRMDGAGCIGLPLPGTELKFVPNGEKFELRVRGVSVSPGYRNAPHLTAEAFDHEGYYRAGDAGFLVDAAHPEQGVMFNGRVAEDFKLTTGTWVSVGTLRPRLVSALAPFAQDVVVAGHDRGEIGILVFPSTHARSLPEAEVADKVRLVLAGLRDEGLGSSQCPTRALILRDVPSADAGEITDKGYLNQRAVLARRAADIEALYSSDDARVIRPMAASTAAS